MGQRFATTTIVGGADGAANDRGKPASGGREGGYE